MSRLNQSHKRSLVYIYFFNLFLFFKTGLKDYLLIVVSRKFTSKIWSDLIFYSPTSFRFFLFQWQWLLRCTWNVLGTCLPWHSALALFSAWNTLSLIINMADFLPSESAFSGIPPWAFNLKYQANHSITSTLLLLTPVQNFYLPYSVLFFNSLYHLLTYNIILIKWPHCILLKKEAY